MRATRKRLPARLLAIGIGALASAPAGAAEGVALWHFDDAAQVGEAFVTGRFGRGLRPGLLKGAGLPPERESAALTGNPIDSRLNIGASDWTIECWLRLDAGAAGSDEGVIFELGAGRREAPEYVTRFSVLPREAAFALTGLVTAAEGAARRVEFANADGPPAGEAWVQTATLALAGSEVLPRERWFHVALVHVADAGALRLYLDGRARAVAAMQLRSLPRGHEAYVALGRDGSGRRALGGVIDELRVSARAVYAAEFARPGSLVPARASP